MMSMEEYEEIFVNNKKYNLVRETLVDGKRELYNNKEKKIDYSKKYLTIVPLNMYMKASMSMFFHHLQNN